MATVEVSREFWNVKYDWRQNGEEWSQDWGNSETQWWGSLLPRIHSFVPCGHILEIAPGFGRWTNCLADLCQKLTAVDLSKRCVEHCRERFAHARHLTFAVNDGKSLNMVPDRSVDFVFSYDSLVHAEADVIEAYVRQLARKLRPNGVAFIHHSNALRYRAYFSLTMRLPRGRQFLMRRGWLRNDHGRSLTMSAELFVEYCQKAGVQCVSQEIVNWRGRALLDCFSVFTPKGSAYERPNQVIENPDFMAEARNLSRMAPLYTRRGKDSRRSK